MISYQNHKTEQDESSGKALIRNQLKICSKLHFVNMIYKHPPVWNRPGVIPYLEITGIVVNPTFRLWRGFGFYTGEVRTWVTNKKKQQHFMCKCHSSCILGESDYPALGILLLQQQGQEALQWTCYTYCTVKDRCLYMPLSSCTCYNKKVRTGEA